MITFVVNIVVFRMVSEEFVCEDCENTSRRLNFTTKVEGGLLQFRDHV